MLKRKCKNLIIYMSVLALLVSVITIHRREQLFKMTVGEYIKWVDFTVTAEALSDAYKADIEAHESDIKLNMVELLSLLGAKYGGDFSHYKKSDLTAICDSIKNGENISELAARYSYYSYFSEAYSAVLEGFVGKYYVDGAECYGLKVFSPIAKSFGYSHSDDFGASRSYGYNRKHLGHDMMGSVGTPIVAVESGIVEAVGWNQYGGWRVGIRSFDSKRYYYYAHLRKDHPYASDIQVGDIVLAGDVIGYMGMTGYSVKENVNNINTPHLHFGIQLIFDASQKDGYNQIWINCYEIVKFLEQNRMPVVKAADGNNMIKAKNIDFVDIPD